MKKLNTMSDAVRVGCQVGFEQAREHPEQTLEGFMAQIDGLQEQLSALPDWKLRLVAGRGTAWDRFRLKFAGNGND